MMLYWGAVNTGKTELERYSWINNSSICWLRDENFYITSSVSRQISEYVYEVLRLEMGLPYDTTKRVVMKYVKMSVDYNNYPLFHNESFPQIAEDHLHFYKQEFNKSSKYLMIEEEKIKHIHKQNIDLRDISNKKKVSNIDWRDFFKQNDITVVLKLPEFVIPAVHNTASPKLLKDLDLLISLSDKNLLPFRTFTGDDRDIEKIINRIHMFPSDLFAFKSVFSVWKKNKKLVFDYLDDFVKEQRKIEKYLIDRNIPYEYFDLDDPNRLDVFGWKPAYNFDFHHTPYNLSNPIIKEKYDMAFKIATEWLKYRNLKDTRLEYASIDGLTV